MYIPPAVVKMPKWRQSSIDSREAPPSAERHRHASAIDCAKFSTREETAWVGVRWRIGKNTFAHVLMIEAGWPPAYVKTAGTDGTACVLTFRSRLSEVNAEALATDPLFKPVWIPDIAGLFLRDDTDWKEVAKLAEASCRRLAPERLTRSPS